MKAAYSTSCFSNDNDYYRAYVKWKQLKERRLLNCTIYTKVQPTNQRSRFVHYFNEHLLT